MSDPKRRIFWMLACSFMALFSSKMDPYICIGFVLLAMLTITANALALTVDGRAQK